MSFKHLGSGLLLLATLTACQDGGDSGTPPPPIARDVPVTTASTEALELFLEGRQAMEIGRESEAHELFQQAVELDPGFSYAHLSLAFTAASAREFADHLGRARAHLEGKSDGERILVEITETYFDNDSEKRLGLARSLVEHYPEGPRAQLMLAGIQTDQNQDAAARESIERATLLDDSLLAAHYAAWRSYLFDEPTDFARAERAMWRCLELDPEEAKPYENLGDVYRAMGDLERAAEVYQRAVEKDPSLTVAHVKQGHVASFLGRFDEARAAYDAALEAARDQTRITYANYRAFTHLHAGDPRAALDELSGLIELADTLGLSADKVLGAKIFTLTNQATIALHHGLEDDAENILETLAGAMRANSESVGDGDFTRLQEANILLWQSQLEARRGDAETALALAEEHRALLADDRNPRRFEGYHGLLGLIALLDGRNAEAVEHLEQSDLGRIYVKYHLALAAEGAGQTERARKLFREVAEWGFNSVGYALVRRDALARMG